MFTTQYNEKKLLIIRADKEPNKNDYTGSTSTSDANNLLIPKPPETFKILSPFLEYIVRVPIKKHEGRQNLIE